MSRQTIDFANEFINHLTALEMTRVKMEELLVRGELDLDDIEQVYSGLYLDIFTSFEGLLENLFFGLLLGKFTSVSPDIVSKVSAQSSPAAHDILFIGKDYLEWLPYQNTLKRAEVCFENGIPFSRLDDGDKSKLQYYYWIRNAIAHTSDFAQQKFEDKVIRSQIVTPRERKPTGYLRGIFRSPSQRQYQTIAEEFKAISLKICG